MVLVPDFPVQTVTNQYPSWYDLRCCKDVKLQQPGIMIYMMYCALCEYKQRHRIQVDHLVVIETFTTQDKAGLLNRIRCVRLIQ